MADAAKAMLIDRMVTALTASCITALDASDDTRAGIVQAGREYEGQPDLDRIIIQVLDSHPQEDIRWMDDMKGYETDLGFSLPEHGKGLLGGLRWNTQRGTVRGVINLNRTGETGSTAMNIRQTVLARVKSTLQQDATLRGFTDDFGESVHYFQVARQPEYDLVEGNYEAYIDWAALTTLPR